MPHENAPKNHAFIFQGLRNQTLRPVISQKIPIAEATNEMAKELNLEPVTISLNGGEDYELLFTVPLAEFEKVNVLSGISIIGHMTAKDEGTCLVMPDGSLTGIQSMGWNSLKG